MRVYFPLSFSLLSSNGTGLQGNNRIFFFFFLPFFLDYIPRRVIVSPSCFPPPSKIPFFSPEPPSFTGCARRLRLLFFPFFPFFPPPLLGIIAGTGYIFFFFSLSRPPRVRSLPVFYREKIDAKKRLTALFFLFLLSFDDFFKKGALSPPSFSLSPAITLRASLPPPRLLNEAG